MGLWSIITGANKVGNVVDTGLGVVESAVKGLDAIVYTDEEKALDAAKNLTKRMDHALAFAKITQSESGASAITRRIAMMIVLGNFTLFTTTGLVLVLLDKINILNNLIEFAKVMGIATLTVTVIASMFGYYAITKNRK
jgi:hypothetical protein